MIVRREKENSVVQRTMKKRETVRHGGRERGGGGEVEEEVADSTFLIQGEAIKMTEPLLACADLYPFTTQRVPDKK